MYELHMSMTIKIVRGLGGIRKDRAVFFAMHSGFDLRSNPEDREMPLPTFFLGKGFINHNIEKRWILSFLCFSVF